MWEEDSLVFIKDVKSASINAIITSPPFALTREKSYGNEPEDRYIEWFMEFAKEFHRVLKDDGSLVLDLGGAWLPGGPTRSLYQFRLLIRLCDELGFHLAEEFYWYNTAKIPGPREWVTKRRVRVKDAVNVVWWLSKTKDPKADNRRVLKPYSAAMKRLIARRSYNQGERPSGHEVGNKWASDNGGAIPSNVIEGALEEELLDNLIDTPNTSAHDGYLNHVRENKLKHHPARFPRLLPEFFVKFLTEPGDVVFDPFAGSNMTGAVAEDLERRWISCELDSEFIEGSIGRFSAASLASRLETSTVSDVRIVRRPRLSPQRAVAPEQGHSAVPAV